MTSLAPDPTFDLDELCRLTGVPKRTVRYYMQIGLVDRAIGETRAAHYTGRHLHQLLRIRELSAAGISLERIRAVLQGDDAPVPVRSRAPGAIEVRTHVHVAPGIELQIAPEDAQLAPERLQAFVQSVLRAWQAIQESDHE